MQSANGLWDSPAGYTSKLKGVPYPGHSLGFPKEFELRTAEGQIYTFGVIDTKDPYVVGRIYRLSKIEDANGNTMSVTYTALAIANDSYPNSTVYKAVDKVTDTFGRKIRFNYGSFYNAGKVVRNVLSSVVDFTGRAVVFGYAGDPVTGMYLETSRSPSVAGTPTGNDFPEGKKTFYGYDLNQQWSGPGRLPTSISPLLTSIVNPNEYQNGAGSLTPYLTNQYSQGPDPKVTRQWLGGVNSSGIRSGGLYRFLYQIQPPGQSIDHGNGILEHSRTLVIDPNGSASLTVFDDSGQDVLSWNFTGRVDPELAGSISATATVDPASPDGSLGGLNSSAPGYSPPLRPSDPPSYVTRKYFNASGQMTELVGAGSHYRYTYYSGPDAFQQGNLVAEERIPVPADGSDPQVTVYMFEPFGGGLRASYPPISFDSNHVPANGGSTGADPERYATKYFYDYQEGEVDGSGLALEAASWGIDIDQTSLDSIYAQYGITHTPVTSDDQKGDLNTDGQVGERFARLVLVQEPTANVWSDPANPTSTFVPQGCETKIVYNAFGLPIKNIDERGNATEKFYYSEADPDGDGTAVVGGGSSVTGQQGGGHLKRDETPEGVTFEQEYDALGRPTTTTYFRGTTAITSTTEYNAQGEVVQETNAVGDVEQFLYDWNGNQVQQRIQHRIPETNSSGSLTGAMVAGPSGGFIDQFYKYDIQGNLVQEDVQVDSQSRSVTRHRYDKVGNLAMTLNPVRSASEPHNYTTHVYDELGRLWSTTRAGRTADFNALLADEDIPERGGLTNSPDASTSYNYYDGAHVLVKSVDGDGKITTLTTDSFGRTKRKTDALGNYTEFVMDANGQRIQTFVYDSQNTLLAHTKAAYDELGRAFQTDAQLFQIDAGSVPLFEGLLTPGDGFVTSRVLYDPAGNVVKIVDDDGGVLAQAFDADHRIVSRKDARGNETLYAYDGTGNTNRVESREVDDAGVLKKTVIGWSFYDYADRVVATLDSLGNVQRLAYDSRGLLIYQSDARSALFSSDATSLDLYGEHADLGSISSINLEGNTTTYTIDDRGAITVSKSYFRDDGLGGNPIDANAGSDGVVTLQNTFDLNGRLRSRTDDEGNTTTYEYDALNRLVKTVRADQTETTVGYNKRDLVTSEVSARGDSTVSIYDDAGRVTARLITYANQGGLETENFDYDGLNRLTLAINSEASVGRYYDSLGRLVRESLDGYQTDMGYGAGGAMVYLKYPSGRLIERDYDTSGFLTEISEQGQPNWSVEFDYEGGRLDAVRYGNGTQALIDYDAIGRPTAFKVEHTSTSTLIEHRGTEWDVDSNCSARVDYSRGRRFDYEYDSLSRLIVSKRGDGVVVDATTSYGLDGTGNRITVQGGISSGLSAMLPFATFASVNKYSSSPPYTNINYDLNGNLTQRTDVSVADFQYDYRNLMTHFLDQGTGEQWQYGYDALGRRVSKTLVGVGTIEYRYVGFELCEEADGITLTTNTYVYGDGVDELLSVRRNGIDTYYHADSQGNVLAITDASGVALEQYEYDDFGLVRNASDLTALVGVGLSGNSHYFTGRPLDWESQLYYVRARMLDPRLGRFTTRDPLGGWADSLSLGNGYTYCGNNPWTCVDPAGTKAKKGKRRRGRLSAQFQKSRMRKARAKARKALRRLKRAARKEYRKAAQAGRDPDFTSVLEEFLKYKPAGLKCEITQEVSDSKKGPNGEPLEILREVITGFDVSLSYAVEIERPAKAESEPPSALPQGEAGSGGSESGSGGGVGSAILETSWGLAGSFIPGVGEAQDLMIFLEEESTWVDKTLAGGSLILSIFTGGLSPNYSAIAKTGKGFAKIVGAIGKSGDEIVDVARAVKNSRRAAFRRAKRQNGIPMSQQPSSVGPNLDRRGNVQPGRAYHFDTPNGRKTIREDSNGHLYPDDPTQNRGPHFNDPSGNHYDYD